MAEPEVRARGAMNAVSVVIPCRNEARYIGRCLDSIFANDFPEDRLEVLVVDGSSDDGTRAVLDEYARSHSRLRVMENPRRTTPVALNTGIRAARYPVIMRMDAHTTYAPDYIRRCEEALRTSGADNVGGVWIIAPASQSLFAEAIAVVFASRFGVGNAYYRLAPTEPREVDTVPFGCYRRELFDRIGLFDEKLRRGQDMEFNARLRAAGGRILLLPDVVSYYHPRTEVGAFFRHNFRNGVWLLYPLRYGRVAFSARHLVPGVFVATLLVTALSGSLWESAWYLFLIAAASYVAALLVATVHGAWSRRRATLLVTLPWVFASLHGAYGLGTVVSLFLLLRHRPFWRSILRGIART